MGIFNGLFKPNVEKLAAKKDVEGLIKALKHKEASVQVAADYALEEIEDASAVEPLLQALKDEDEHVRWRAVERLGFIGDKRALDPLILALKDKEKNVRYVAARALGEIGDKRAVESLIEAFRDSDEDVRINAVYALGELKSKKAVKVLKEALKDNYMGAAWALGQIGLASGDVELLIIGLEDTAESEEARQFAKALGKTGDKRVVKPLIVAATEFDPSMGLPATSNEKAEVAKMLVDEALRIDTEEAIGPLCEALERDNIYVRELAAKALGGIGDKKAVEPLKKALNDEDMDVREVAKEAIKKIQKK